MKKSVILVEKQFYDTYFYDYLHSLSVAFPFIQIVPIPFALFKNGTNTKLIDSLFINPIVANIIWIQQCPFLHNTILEFKQKYPDIRWYLLNTEQMSCLRYFENLYQQISHFDGILDYQYDNKKYFFNKLYERNIQSIPISYDIIPYQLNNSEYMDQDKIYDCAIIGLNSDRRRAIYNQLQQAGIRVLNVEGWGFMRDNILFRCKTLVNVHYDEDYQIYETMRCDRCTWNKMIVISETSFSDNADNNISLKKYIIECPYDNIVDMVKHVLTNYESIYQHLFGNEYEQEKRIIQERRREIIQNINFT